MTLLSLSGRTVVLKEPLGPDAPRRLRHELAMLERLRGVPGVVQLVQEPRYPGAMSLADVGGTSLAALTTPLDADELIRLGSALAQAVAGRIRVSDDGRGGADLGGGSGLVGLKDRVEALGGRFSVQTAPDAGTTVHVETSTDPASHHPRLTGASVGCGTRCRVRTCRGPSPQPR